MGPAGPPRRHRLAGSRGPASHPRGPGTHVDQLLCRVEGALRTWGSWVLGSPSTLRRCKVVLTQEPSLCGGKPRQCARPGGAESVHCGLPTCLSPHWFFTQMMLIRVMRLIFFHNNRVSLHRGCTEQGAECGTKSGRPPLPQLGSLLGLPSPRAGTRFSNVHRGQVWAPGLPLTRPGQEYKWRAIYFTATV